MEDRQLIVKSTIKTLIEPVVMEAVRSGPKVSRQLGYQEDDIVVIITGGAALERYFNNLSPLLTADWDLKIMTAQDLPEPIPFEQQQMFRDKLAQKLVENFNRYYRGIQKKMAEVLQKNGFQLLLSSRGQPFELQEEYNRLTTIRYSLRDIESGEALSENIVDLYIPDVQKKKHMLAFTEANQEHPILAQGNNGPYLIPVNKIDDIFYASLGYLVWDTQRMIEDSIERKLPKLQRYRDKMDSIYVGLSNPSASLTCYTMSQFLDQCGRVDSDFCSGATGRVLTSQQLVQHGIDNGVYSPQYRSQLEKFSRPYLCDLYNRIRQSIITALE